MKLLVIDNYDSFVYNLVHIIQSLGLVKQLDVVRNDKIDLDSLGAYDKILLSPGPGIPKEAGQLMQVIKRYADTKDILGVCLGHQALAEHFGGKLTNLDAVYHGIATNISLQAESVLFNNLPQQFKVGRYHSWVVESPLPQMLTVTATDGNKQVMAFEHDEKPIYGVQFHPESVLTEHGKKILQNWIQTS